MVLGAEPGDICSFVVGGHFLYVAGPQEPVGGLRLEERSAVSGALVATALVPRAPMSVDLAISGRYLWAAGGDPGANGGLYLFDASSLKLVGASSFGEKGWPPPRTDRLPVFGQFLQVDISGGTVWVGSDGVVACFNACTAQLRSSGIPKPELVTDDVVVAQQRTFGIDDWTGGIVRLRPPLACRDNP